MLQPIRARHPHWIPDAVRHYLDHVAGGRSLRSLARDSGCHASTVMRQIRRCEQLREDPLIDIALMRLGHRHASQLTRRSHIDGVSDPMSSSHDIALIDDETIDREARRILRRLAEPGACLAVAQGMDKAVVVREGADGQTIRTGVIDTSVAEAMALKDWIAGGGGGRVTRYTITATGRSALKDMLDGDEEEDGRTARGRARYGTAETPLMALARRRDKDGEPFLKPALVRTGERLREDFELARMGEGDGRDWDGIVAGDIAAAPEIDFTGTGPEAARARVESALAELGPGLGDVVLRVCCYLEGLESVEKRMGWAARSGKIVLRIGLQRLQQHHLRTGGTLGPMIG